MRGNDVTTRPQWWSCSIVILHDNARPHTAAATRDLLHQFGWEIFDHPPHSLDLALGYFHLFMKLKELLGGKLLEVMMI